MDSEAQAYKVCGHCETRVDEALAECPECGAPLQGLRLIDNVTDSVHADLSRANLMRMRGEYKQAQDQCLSILKRYPHHFESHLLLADIYADERQYEQAAQWYELAIDLDPGSFIARQRLQVVRDHLRQVETVQTAEHLGIPARSSRRTGVIAGVVVGLIGLAAIVSYSLGQSAGVKKSDVVRSSVSATADSVFEKPVEARPEPEKSEPVATSFITAEDRAATNALKIGPLGDRVLLATIDPRTKTLTLTYRLQEGESERRIGAELARSGFATVADAPQVTLKAVRGETMFYMADVSRARFAETQTDAWRATSAEEDAWIGHVLQNEWFAVPPPDSAPAGDQPVPNTLDPH